MGRKWTNIGGIEAKQIEQPESVGKKLPKTVKSPNVWKKVPRQESGGCQRDRPPHVLGSWSAM